MNDELFDIDINKINIDLEPDKTPDEYILKSKYDEILFKKIERLNEILRDGLKPDIQYRIVTQKPICAISIIEFLIRDEKLKEIYLATYSLNQDTLNRLKYLVAQHQIKCTIVMSDFFSKTKKHQQFSHKIAAWANTTPGVKIKFTVTHAKVFLTKTQSNKNIVFEGSGNLAFNSRIEQYLIENNQTAYNFHKSWMEDLF